jgi:hypothetical protein
MHSITLKYYETYSLNLNIVESPDNSFRFQIQKNDETDSKSHSSSIEFYFTREQLEQISKLIMETLNDK